MNGEKLLRAMSYVDEDLVERAEKVSRRKHSWIRFAAMAACLCLVLGGWMVVKKVFSTAVSCKNAAPMAAPAAQDVGGGYSGKAEARSEESAADESGEKAPSPTEMPEMEPARPTGDMDTGDWFIRMGSESAINAAADLPGPMVIRTRRELEGHAIPPEVLERYGEDFFLTQDLLLAAVEGGREHPQVIRLEDTGEGWVLTVSGSSEGEDAVQWLLLLPIEKDLIPEEQTIQIEEETK